MHAVAALRQALPAHPALELLDGGVMGLDLLAVVEECSHLLLLDAIDAAQPGGTLIEMRKEEIPLYRGVMLSEHQVSFQEVLGLALFRDRLPQHLHLIGVQPADLSAGLELSPTVAAVLPALVERTRRLLHDWQLLA